MNCVKSYAKVNLGLCVVKKTKNNYHKLKMIMSLIELHDEIFFEDSDEIIVETNKNICNMNDNLCYKIAIYLKEKYKIQEGIKIFIKKTIPDGGGLGGGSSNAAAVLKYLNDKWCLKLTNKKLKEIGFLFGCDIPFFIDGDVSFVTGFGQKVKVISHKIKQKNEEIILVIPNFKCSTKTIFENHSLNKSGKNKIKKLIKNLKKGDYKNSLFNDLEQTVDSLMENKISSFKDAAYSMGVYNVLMSGSGSTIVCYFDEKDDIDVFVEKIKNAFPEYIIIKSKLKMYSY